jgi:hypothetical protein
VPELKVKFVIGVARKAFTVATVIVIVEALRLTTLVNKPLSTI